MKRYLPILALLLAAVLAWKANAFPNLGNAIDDTNGTSQAATDPWVDSTGVQWVYDKNASVWVAPGPTLLFCHSGSFTGGAYGLYSASAVAGDTTTASGAIGIVYPESLYVRRYRWWDRMAAAGVNDTNQVYVGTTLLSQAAWSGDTGTKERVNTFIGSSAVITAWLKAKSSGAVHPFTPFLIIETSRFRRPAAPPQ